MKKLYAVFFVVMISFAASAQHSAAHVPGQTLVKLKPGFEPEILLNEISHVYGLPAALRVEDDLSQKLNIWKLSFNPAIDENRLLDRLKQHPAVEIAQFNHFVQQRDTPNDPNFGNQWHHIDGSDNDIDSDLAWDITTGGLTALGDEIVVCVVEGGNLMHTDLIENRWVNVNEIPNNGVDDDENGFIDDYDGWNVQSETDNGVFDGGHGTQVMGMIGAKGDNNLGVAGINWNVKIMSVAGESLGDESSIIEAYNYALVMRELYDTSGGQKGAFVVATNASWGIDGGNPDDAPLWCAVYDALGEVGVLSCGATANNNVNIDVVGDLPTACGSDYMISVTATNNNDQRTFSAYGAINVDLGAPGENVWTTSGSSTYGSTSGTSFASPLTAGAIALLYSVPCPSLMAVVHSDPQTGADIIRQALFDGVDPVAQLENETVTGGRLNVFNSLNILIENCSANECLNPFAVGFTSENGVDQTVSWTSLETVVSVDLRYRVVGNPLWVTIENISGNNYQLNELEWCSEYEVQLLSNCEGESGDWSDSYLFTTDGCCVAPLADLIEIISISQSNIEIVWQTVLAAQSYDVGIAVSGTNDFTTTEGVEGNSFTFEGLEGCTNYDIRIATNCAGDEFSEYSQLFTFNTPGCGNCVDSEYCPVGSDDASEEWIARVRLNTIDNETPSDNGYGDYTSVSTVLETNNTYNIILTPGFGGFDYNEFWMAWIDYNQNGTFENSEVVHESDAASPNENNGTFSIAANVPLGSTRMRVSMKYIGFGGTAPTPCEMLEYGEIEDYCITLEEGVGLNENNLVGLNVYPNPSNGVFNIEMPQNIGNVSLEVFDVSGRIVLSEVLVKPQFDLSSFPSGIYIYRLGMTNGNSIQGLIEKH